jgi:pimeloyl-ACP methyl ester carboxylesterase
MRASFRSAAIRIRDELPSLANNQLIKLMTRGKPQPKPLSRPERSGFAPAHGRALARSAPPTVSGRWLLIAIAVVIPAAAFCAWAVLCLLFWQGSWQLLYHPSATVARTPASIGLAFNPVGFATTDTGVSRLQGWWISAGPTARHTVLYLHGQDGNLGDTLDDQARLHGAGVNVLAFDYRGFGQSQFVHPGEPRLRQDADWALQYLTSTRHIDPRSIVLIGTGLGANLALEVAAAHPELAGVVLESPLDAPVDVIFGDPRARLVPAHLLASDRFDMNASAAALHIPSLWFVPNPPPGQAASTEISTAFQKVTATKMRVWLKPSSGAKNDFTVALSRWLDSLNP